jgi:hypothetical protein
MRQRFKDRGMQEMYETCRRLAADKTSTFWNADGTRHRGASHRNYYWHGLDGVRPVGLVQDTLGYACWRAGMDDRKQTL